MSTFIIAEIGPNHNGDADIAKRMVEDLADAGVDAVKFQLSDPEKALSKDAFKAAYQLQNDNADDVIEAAKKRQLSRESHIELKTLCDEIGVEYLCTAFDLGSLQFLDREIGVTRFKVGSGDLLTRDLGEYIGASDKPAIVSTGMATIEEIQKGLRLHNPQGVSSKVTLLHCVSSYPAPYEIVNLRWMPEMARQFGVPVGYSDHTLGNEAAIAAVALGATIIEKHVTLDKSLPGPDHKASATIGEFASLVQSIRRTESALGTAEKTVSQIEIEISQVARKSIVSARQLELGHRISREDVCFKRPGTGLLPTELERVIGRRTNKVIEEDRVIRAEDLD